MSSLERSFVLDGERVARVRFSSAAEGDLAIEAPQPALDERRAQLVPLPWTWLKQVHGNDVAVVHHPGAAAGAEADAAVTRCTGAPLAVHTADCAPVALVGRSGAVGAVHVGWRGLVTGVLDRALDALDELGSGEVTATLGPCIHATCYEFGAHDLDAVARVVGDVVRATTPEGRPALDLPAGVCAVLARRGVRLDPDEPPDCTACTSGFFSYRARHDAARQAMVVWIEG